MKFSFVYRFIFILSIIVFINNQQSFAQDTTNDKQVYTDIPGGDISGILSCAGSPYHVLGDINIPVGEELIIEPCVQLLFDGEFTFKISGRLLAIGDETNQITFTSSDSINLWEGIKFININSNGQDSSKMVNCEISYSSADPGGPTGNNQGGAIYFKQASNVLIESCKMNNNYAASSGGAIFLDGSLPALKNNIIRNNNSPNGGAISFQWSTAVIYGGIIENNEAEYGGACFLNGSNPTFSGVTIRNNYAKFGGGIYMYGGCTPVFDPINLCNIYMNYAYACGLDFCTTSWWGFSITINVDTFGVLNPNEHFVYPKDIYTLNIQNSLIEQVDHDLYVSPTGSDSNSGATSGDPLKTMHMALMKIEADTLDSKIIHLEGGTYSEGATGEIMPINWREHVSMIGDGPSTKTIDGEDVNQLLYCYDDNYFEMNGIEFTNGFAVDGGAIYLEHYSSPEMSDLLIHGNNVSGDGGGVYFKDHSSPLVSNVDIYNNFAGGGGGGIFLLTYSNPVFRSVNINNNSVNYTGGGLRSYLYCDFIMDSVSIFANSAAHGAGMYVHFYSDPIITNSEIYSNHAISYSGYPASGGGVTIAYGSRAIFDNVEVSNNTSDNNAGGINCDANILFQNGKINNNYTQNSGGGLYLSGNDIRFVNTEICSNVADDSRGAAVYASSSSGEFVNVIISKNLSVNDYACLMYCHNSDLVLTNSILWGNSPIWFDIYSGTITAEYSNTQFPLPGTGNISTDPLFTDMVANDYSLQETSLCIDVGTPDTTGLSLPLLDLAANPRIINEIIDMGAYEYLSANTMFLGIKVFLEGPFNGIDMNTDLSPGNLPLSQPYNTAPWNYDGGESVAAIPNSNIVDWILVEIRDASLPDVAQPATVIGQQAGFLLSNGSIVGLEGASYLAFYDISVEYSMYFVIWHRNHLGIMSSFGSPLAEFIQINFPIGSGGVYSTGPGGYKEIASGVFGMVAGDANGDGEINAIDKTAWETDAGISGYELTDFNLDFEVDNQDKNDFWLINIGDECQVPNSECGEVFIDSRDGQAYNTVQIGTKCWMAENLNVGTFSSIGNQTNDSIIEKSCYDNNVGNCDTYGGLYQWGEMMGYSTIPGVQGICPTGWHLPTDAEWCTLENYVDIGTVSCSETGERGTDAGGNLKETGIAHWDSPNTGATNTSGFTALPGGFRNPDGSYFNLSFISEFWSSNGGDGIAWERSQAYSNTKVYREQYNVNYSFSVRCLSD